MQSVSQVLARDCPLLSQQDEDMSLLIQEMQQGYSDLEKMQELYSESLVMDWWYNGEKGGGFK